MSIAHITLATRNVTATADFYHHTLGWKPVAAPTNAPIEIAWLQIAPGQQLHILHKDDFEPSAHEAEFGRHIAVFYPGDQFDALKQRLRAKDAELFDPIRPTPFDRFFFKDPNGYIFEVIDEDHYVTES